MTLIQKQIQAEVRRSFKLKYFVHQPTAGPPAEGYPLILFLHGAGQRGDDLEIMADHGLLMQVNAQADFPYLVCAPQCPLGETWALYLDELCLLLDEMERDYPVNADRIIISGLSMGGNGSWLLACKDPRRFAAAVPICGWGDWILDFPERVASMRSVPVWAFHGADDDVIPVAESQKMVDALTSAGGQAKLTIYPGVTHNSWDQAYAEAELYGWLESKRRKV
ncbi:MAG: prolyl oligopeptidase family serine peptidase [FCB group bacterium]|nr:prolyl oligopeptidase family serine peptidase [FCB group bacterium]